MVFFNVKGVSLMRFPRSIIIIFTIKWRKFTHVNVLPASMVKKRKKEKDTLLRFCLNFLRYSSEKSNGIAKIFGFGFLMDLHVLRCPEHDLNNDYAFIF